MKEKETVRLSFDVPVEEHILIKTECVRSRMAVKDFLHNLVRMGLEQYRKAQFKQKMEGSIQQAKEGKVRTVTAEELDKWEKELEDETE
jgi:hypothetical protein